MFYYIVLLLLAILSVLDIALPDKRSKKILYILTVSALVLIGGLRWNTGNDWRAYYTYFIYFDYSEYYDRIRFETGYVQLVRFVSFFTNNYTVFLLVFSTLVIGLKAHFFYKYTGAVFVALMLYWGSFLADITAVRQMMAMSLCLVALPYLVKKNLFKFVLVVTLAMSFHASAFIFYFSYFIYNKNWSVRLKISLLITSILMGSFGVVNGILSFATEYLDNLFPYLSGKANSYQNLGEDLNYASLNKSTILILGILKRAIVIPIILYYENDISKENKVYKGFSNLFIFGNCIYFIVIDFLSVQRMASYFYPLEIILFCLVFDFLKNKSIFLIFLVLYSIMKLTNSISIASDLLVPYIWIFQEDTYRQMR